MNRYNFVEGRPSDFTPSVESTLFHDPAHLALQDGKHWYSFFILNQNATCDGLVHFHVDNNMATSHLRSPYGSFILNPELDKNTVEAFVVFVTDRLEQLKVKRINIKNYPDFLFVEGALTLHMALERHGYTVMLTESSAYIPVGVKSITSLMYKAQVRRLRKCHEAGFRFVQLDPEHLDVVYNFIKTCRLTKGYKLSMSLHDVEQLQKTFPSRVILFGVYDGDRLAAASLSILERSTSIYDFYHDHDADYDDVSPVTFLMEGIYGYCQREKISYINLGTSMIGDRVNESLLEFKRSLGASTSTRRTYYRMMS